jgi:cytochrome c oxidase accessory protein FixG
MMTNTSQTADQSTIDQYDVKPVNAKKNRSLYEARKKIHPKRVSGSFRKLKWWIMAVTLGIYYLTPWIRWDRGPEAPDQAVLVDLANRRFYFFFIEIWPHEFFFVAGLLVMAGIGLFLVTSTLGRAWCGYTCPQTVWVDLFLVVERFFEGDRNARMKLDKAPWTASKIYKRIAKHTTWIVIGVLTGGAWIFYFADAPTLLNDFATGQAPFVAYSTVAILTATTYIFGGLMREQVCTYMCPWPRVQAAMLDEDSLTVTYNGWRGEPRSRHAKRMRADNQAIGDCVDCNACVAVCPMGIDIRDGQQMECITCALCIDACDTVMQKLGLEKGLISYSTLQDYNANMRLAGGIPSKVNEGNKAVFETVDPARVRNPDGRLVSGIAYTNWKSIIRPRTVLYTGIYAAIGFALLFALAVRDRLDVNILHDRNPVFVTLSDGSIRNGYEVKILNMRGQTRDFQLNLKDLPGASMTLAGSNKTLGQTLTTQVPANQIKNLRLFITVASDKVQPGTTEFSIEVKALNNDDVALTTANFETPR